MDQLLNMKDDTSSEEGNEEMELGTCTSAAATLLKNNTNLTRSHTTLTANEESPTKQSQLNPMMNTTSKKERNTTITIHEITKKAAKRQLTEMERLKSLYSTAAAFAAAKKNKKQSELNGLTTNLMNEKNTNTRKKPITNSINILNNPINIPPPRTHTSNSTRTNPMMVHPLRSPHTNDPSYVPMTHMEPTPLDVLMSQQTMEQKLALVQNDPMKVSINGTTAHKDLSNPNHAKLYGPHGHVAPHSQSGVNQINHDLGPISTTGMAMMDELERKNRKEKFLMFIRVLMKFLEQKDPNRHAQAKLVIRDCATKHKQGDPHYQSLSLSMQESLRELVGEVFWKRAEEYLAQFLKTSLMKKQQPPPMKEAIRIAENFAKIAAAPLNNTGHTNYNKRSRIVQDGINMVPNINTMNTINHSSFNPIPMNMSSSHLRTTCPSLPPNTISTAVNGSRNRNMGILSSQPLPHVLRNFPKGNSHPQELESARSQVSQVSTMPPVPPGSRNTPSHPGIHTGNELKLLHNVNNIPTVPNVIPPQSIPSRGDTSPSWNRSRSMLHLKQETSDPNREYHEFMEFIDHASLYDSQSCGFLLGTEYRKQGVLDLNKEQKLLLNGINVFDKARNLSPSSSCIPLFLRGWGSRNVLNPRVAFAKLQLMETLEQEHLLRNTWLLPFKDTLTYKYPSSVESPWVNETFAEEDPVLCLLSEATQKYIHSILEASIRSAGTRLNLHGIRLWHQQHALSAHYSINLSYPFTGNPVDSPGAPLKLRLGCDVTRQIALAEGNSAKTSQRMEEALARHTQDWPVSKWSLLTNKNIMNAWSMGELSKIPKLPTAVERAKLDAKRKFQFFGGKECSGPPLGRVPKRVMITKEDILSCSRERIRFLPGKNFM